MRVRLRRRVAMGARARLSVWFASPDCAQPRFHPAAPPRLPMSHTCFRALDLPEYASKEELADALLKAVDYGSSGFEFA